jgi:hypothetical protein
VQTIQPGLDDEGFDPQFAVDDTYLYAIDHATTTLFVYRTDRRGPQRPLSSQRVVGQGVIGVAVGP